MGDRIHGGAYRLAWSDEFDGASGTPADGGPGRPRSADPGRATRNCSITPMSRAMPPSTGPGIWPSWSSRLIRSWPHGGTAAAGTPPRADQQGPGVVLVRADTGADKDPACARDLAPFWMLGQDIGRSGWPGCGEIDVMEHFGTGPATVHGTVHRPGILRAGRHQLTVCAAAKT